jgi:predicted nucleotidyltransferase
LTPSGIAMTKGNDREEVAKRRSSISKARTYGEIGDFWDEHDQPLASGKGAETQAPPQAWITEANDPKSLPTKSRKNGRNHPMDTLDAKVTSRALAAAKTLARLGVVRAAYVFGSQVEGKADAWSDIDMAAFMEGIEDWDIRKRAKAMALVMEEAGSDVEAHLFPASALENPQPGGFAEYVLRHGTCILGQQQE